MDLREQIKVNGFPVRLQPYTEKRRKLLSDIDKDIEQYTAKVGAMKWDDMPKADKVSFWKRKAMILWEPQPLPDQKESDGWDAANNFFSDDFFSDDGFEYPLLQKAEIFFLNSRVYL